MFEAILGQDQEDNPAESNDDTAREWSPTHSLSPKLGINFVPAGSDLNTTAWGTNFEKAQFHPFVNTTVAPPRPLAPYVQEYNLVKHVGSSQETTQLFAATDHSNYYGTHVHPFWSTLGQPARTSSTYSVLIP